tara:strand:- start:231 stop:392 length:162 start_codon:yes stop_codon:yes gene_type:complete
MDIRKIKTLIEMLEESNLKEIEVSQGEESVRITKGNNKAIAENSSEESSSENS